MAEVTWRTHPLYDIYEISSDGQVQSIDRQTVAVDGRHIRRKGQVLKQSLSRKGYYHVTVYGDRKRRSADVHRLVCEAFHGLCADEDMEARHLNGVSTDNRPENLAWGTRSENMQDRLRHGRNSNANKTQCRFGHPYDDANTFVTSAGTRACRLCRKLDRRWRKYLKACRSQGKGSLIGSR